MGNLIQLSRFVFLCYLFINTQLFLSFINLTYEIILECQKYIWKMCQNFFSAVDGVHIQIKLCEALKRLVLAQ